MSDCHIDHSGMTDGEELEHILATRAEMDCQNPRCEERDVEDGLCPVCRLWVDETILPMMRLSIDNDREAVIRKAVFETRLEERRKAKKERRAAVADAAQQGLPI